MADAVLLLQTHLSKTPLVALRQKNGIVSKSFCTRRLFEYFPFGDPLEVPGFS